MVISGILDFVQVSNFSATKEARKKKEPSSQDRREERREGKGRGCEVIYKSPLTVSHSRFLSHKLITTFNKQVKCQKAWPKNSTSCNKPQIPSQNIKARN